MTPTVRATKRLLDVFTSLAGIAATAPLLPVISAAIYLDSPGPIFYRQRRAGRLIGGGHGGGFRFVEFEMLKFRTMQVDAERATGAVLASPGDPRVTRVGRLLRRLRLDELPQFWNVLRGDMSLVGPRPERPELIQHLAAAIPYFEERMRGVKPGVTGLAQVSLGYNGKPPAGSAVTRYRDELTNPFKLAEADDAEADHMRIKLLFDLAYVAALEKFSSYAATEFEVIVRTPLVMVLGRGY